MPTRAEIASWNRLTTARGAAGLVRELSAIGGKRIAPDVWRSLHAITAGTHAFTLRICQIAAKHLRLPLPRCPVRVPRTTDRTDPAWYRTRARGGSVRLALLRAFKKLAVRELPLLEAHIGRREAPMFRIQAKSPWYSALPADIPRREFNRAVRRWLHLMTGKATWLSLRLAEVATRATEDLDCVRETLSVCAAVASEAKLYDPFNTFAAFLEAFYELERDGAKSVSRLLAVADGPSAFRRIVLRAGTGTRWKSARAHLIAKEVIR